MIDRMQIDGAAEKMPARKRKRDVHAQIAAAAAVRPIEAGQYALAAGELNGVVALLLLIAKSQVASIWRG